mmetsp:Transcript_9517/g.15831  ORF Transcript_9517/g.15831 Transcript_9517/m.15831 type:complete len:334 (-) Transcript_9517:244-1245(-)
MNTFRDLTADGNGGNITHVFDTSVGTRSDEYLLDRYTLDLLSFLQTNVRQGAGDGSLTGSVVAFFRNHWDVSTNGGDILRTGTPGNSRGNVLGVHLNHLVKDSILIGRKRLPVGSGLVPILSGWGHWTALEVVTGNVIRSNDSSTSTSFNGHVGDGHAGLHTELLHGSSTKFNGVSGSSSGSNNTANVQNDILGSDTIWKVTVDGNQHVLGLGLGQSLSRKNVFDLTCSNTKGKSTKGTVCSRVTVTANSGAPRKSEALFWSNNVDNTLTLIGHTEILESKVSNIHLELHDLSTGCRFFDKGWDINEFRTIRGRNVVIHSDQSTVGASDTTVG